MTIQNLLYHSIEQNNIKLFNIIIHLPEIDLTKFDNKALSVAFVHERYKIFDILSNIKEVKSHMYADTDKTLLNFYQKRKILNKTNNF
jgi:hypothetical protein